MLVAVQLSLATIIQSDKSGKSTKSALSVERHLRRGKSGSYAEDGGEMGLLKGGGVIYGR